jgi:hypothetical protein
LIGVLIKQGVYDIWQPAPIPEWQSAGDPRAKIRIGDEQGASYTTGRGIGE